jgi:hypothetical protein
MPGLISGEPLEDLHELAHLAAQGHGEVLRGVELLPVPLASELADALLQVLDGVRAHDASLPYPASRSAASSSANRSIRLSKKSRVFSSVK